MKKSLKFYLFFLGLLVYGMFFTDRFRFDFFYSTHVDTFNLYPMWIFRDPTLFVRDAAANMLRQYAGHPALREFALLSIYRVLLQALSLGTALKLMGLFLSFCSALFVYKTGEVIYKDEDKAFFLTTAFLVCVLSMDVFYYGQSRTFGVFLFTLLVYALYSGRYLLAPPLVYLFYIFYPYLAPPAGLISIWIFFSVKWEGSRRTGYLALLLLSLGLAAMTDISPDMAMNHAAAFQPKFTGLMGEAVVPGNPLHFLIYFLMNMSEQGAIYALIVAVFSAVVALAFLRRGWSVLSVLRDPRLAPLSMFLLTFLTLYPVNPLFASRQVVFAFPFVLALLFADNSLFLLGAGRARAAAAVLAAFFAVCHPLLGRISDFSVYSGVYSHISGMPKDITIAGEPDSFMAAGVPFYARRSLYYSVHMPGMMSVFAPDADQEAIRRNLLKALCGPDLAASGRFARENGIDYFLIEQGSGTPKLSGPPNPCGEAEPALYSYAAANNVFQTTVSGEQAYLVDARGLEHEKKRR